MPSETRSRLVKTTSKCRPNQLQISLRFRGNLAEILQKSQTTRGRRKALTKFAVFILSNLFSCINTSFLRQHFSDFLTRADPCSQYDPDARILHEFNRRIFHVPAVTSIMQARLRIGSWRILRVLFSQVTSGTYEKLVRQLSVFFRIKQF